MMTVGGSDQIGGMMLYSALADEAAKLGKDLLEACDYARRAWQFSGQKAYMPAVWDTLHHLDKRVAIDSEKTLLDRYARAYQSLIATAPSLLEIIYEAEQHFETRIRLESALDVAGKPFERINPNQLQCMESPMRQVERLMTRIGYAPVTTSWAIEKSSIPPVEKQELAQMCNGCYRAMAVCTCGDEDGWTEEKEAGYLCETCGESIAICECEKFYPIKELFGDGLFCPFCGEYCTPDYCLSCHSHLHRLEDKGEDTHSSKH
jgi:hypothetical protein